MLGDFSKDINAYFLKLKNTLDGISVDKINEVMNVFIKTLEENKTIFVMGNGGSGATASHFACDFNKGISYMKDKKFKVICLNDNFPTMMAYANDVGYETIFVEQLKNFYKTGDVVVGISGSGNSPNVIEAIKYANINGGVTVGFSGYSGGELLKSAKHNIHVDIDDMQITEDLHMAVVHLMMQIFINDQK